MNTSKEIPQHSLSKSIFYHLFPGLSIFIFYVLLTPYFLSLGFSPSFSLLIGFILIGIPLQLYFINREAAGKGVIDRLKSAIYYRQKIPVWQYFAFPVAFILYAIFINSLLEPFNTYLKSRFVEFPSWFYSDVSEFRRQMPAELLLLSFGAQFLVDGILNPIVEEVYFRGFLLPRISRFKMFSPILNALLFSMAHFWQPWNMLQIFVMVFPLYILVWKQRNFYLAIVVHCLANLIGFFLAVASI